MREIDYRNGRIAQQLFAWGYPVHNILENFYRDGHGYQEVISDKPRVINGYVITQKRPWRHPDHFRILMEIERGEWPEVNP